MKFIEKLKDENDTVSAGPPVHVHKFCFCGAMTMVID